ncbi:MAG: GNAT family N-acetyltransferase [Bacteroidota bacterium]
MSNLRFTPFPTLTTSRLRLKAIEQTDQAAIFALRSDAENRRYIDQNPAKSVQEIQTFMERIQSGMARDEWVFWALVPKEDTSQVLGTICLWHFERATNTAEVGYELAPSAQGKGYMREALSRVVQYAFEALELDRLEAYTHAENMASRRLLERIQFEHQKTYQEQYHNAPGTYAMSLYALQAKQGAHLTK